MAGGEFFTWEKLMCHRPVGRPAQRQSAAVVSLIPLLIFAAYTAALDAFQWAGQCQKLPLPFGDLDLTHGSLGPHQHIPTQTVSQSVQSFLQGSGSDQQTRYSVCSNRPHLAIAAMQPKMQSTVAWNQYYMFIETSTAKYLDTVRTCTSTINADNASYLLVSLYLSILI